MTRGLLYWMLLAALLALGLRAVQLDRRPMHNDESVNAMKIGQLWQGGGYRYDPNEYHGPTLVYSTYLWEKLTLAKDFARFTEARLRSLTVLFGVGLVLLLFLVADGLGRNATVAAALLTAVSPVMVYYSRDYIHESLFVFFIFLFLAAGWRYCRTGKFGWILLAGGAMGLMQATKETFVFNVVAVMGALLLNELAAPVAVASSAPKSLFCPKHLVAAGIAWLAVAAVLFTSFFSHPAGLLDAAGTYLVWFQRAKGASPHVHGGGFYWERLLFFHSAGGPIWSEALVLALAVLGGLAAFGRRGVAGVNRGLARFLVYYTAILALIYTLLPYKTPWSAMGYWHGTILLAGIGAAALPAWLPGARLKMAALAVLLAGAAQLGFQAWQSAVKYAADPVNPWVYAQTLPNLLELVEKVDAVAQASPDGHGTYISVIAPGSDYWPLPWYLRTYRSVGYFTKPPGYSKFAVGEIADLHALVEGFLDSTPFAVDEIRDLPALANRFKGKPDAVSAFLWQTLSNTEQTVVTNEDALGTSPSQAKEILAKALNKLVAGKSIYERERFRDVAMRPGTRSLLEQNPTGANLSRLNRLLLEDAYPRELSRNLLTDSVSQYLVKSGMTNQMDVAHPANGDPDHLESLLVSNLNNILAGPSIYDSNRFQYVHLRPSTEELRRQDPHGQDLIRLNRRLLEDSYPTGLGTNNLPVEPYLPITIVSRRLEADMDEEKAGVMTGLYELRPGFWLELYVQTNLWAAYLEHRGK